MKSLLLTGLMLLGLIIQPSLQAQIGSGNALEMNGTSSYVGTLPIDLSGSGLTMSAWVKVTSFKTAFPFISSIMGTEEPGSTAIIRLGDATFPAEKIQFVLNIASTQEKLDGNQSLSAGRWYHLAVTYDGAEMKIYINGVLDASKTQSGAITSNDLFAIGRNYGNDRTLDGQMDEIRLFNTAVSQATIQEWMCKKININHPNYGSLLGHWNFDEGAGMMAFDQTANGNDGALVANPTWITSGAPMGDISVNTYPASAPFSLSHPDGDSITVTSFSGTPSGMHLYRIDSIPMNTNPPSGLTSLETSRTWGVFYTSGNPTNTLEYNYANNPNLPNVCMLGWADRENQADNVWNASSIANIDFVSTTMEMNMTGSSESVLASSMQGPVGIGLTIVDNVCFGDSMGSATVTATGGLPPYVYQWSSSTNTDSTEIDLLGGWVTVTVTDANNCPSIDSVEISDPQQIILTIDSVKFVTCQGGDDGMIISSATGGAIPYFIQWDDPNAQGSPTAINLPEGLFTIMLTDNNGCEASASALVEFIFAAPQPDLGNDITSSTGFADLVLTSTFPTYAWSNGSNASTIRVFASGDYTVTVTDQNGCTGVDEITVTLAVQGLEEESGLEAVRVFPQPSDNGLFDLELTGNKALTFEMSLSDFSGKLIQTQTLEVNSGLNRWRLDLSAQAKGIYIMSLSSQEGPPILMKVVR